MYYYRPNINPYENLAENMYPEEYHKILPHIQRVCQREDHPYNYQMYPFPREEKINEMIEEIYDEYSKENKKNVDEIKNDEELNRNRYHHRPPHHHPCDYGRDPCETIIKILLIKELLDRRDCRRRPWCR